MAKQSDPKKFVSEEDDIVIVDADGNPVQLKEKGNNERDRPNR